MALRYYNSSRPERVTNPTNAYYDDYVAICEQVFDNAPNVIYEEIQYEAHYGERDFRPIPMVRVDPVVNYNTGMQVGNDWKVFIFTPDFPVEPYFGMMFKWNKNYWLVVNVDGGAGLTTSAEVRRCNNTLRFFDKNGNKIYEPCILDQVLRFTNNNDTMTIVTGKAEQYVWCQRNSRTTSIKPNDRFLFGVPEQRIGFRLYAGGFGNSLNTITEDEYSPSVTQFYMEEYEMDFQQDDIINGFANVDRFEYSIDISENSSFYDIGAKTRLNATVYKGRDIVEEEIIWESSDESIIKIIDGELEALASGDVEIRAYIAKNRNFFGSMPFTVLGSGSQEDKYEILISPDVDYVLEGESEAIEVYLYKNGIKQTDLIDIKDVSVDVPRSNYKLIPRENSFVIENKKFYLLSPIKVQCTCGDTSETFEFTLRGLF